MKRSRTPTRRPRVRESDSDGSRFGNRTAESEEPKWNWTEHVASKPEESFILYTPKTNYEKLSLIKHPTFGKGLVIGVEKGRIEVLFQEGVKKLVALA